LGRQSFPKGGIFIFANAPMFTTYMKVLIQDKQNKKFFAANDGWVSDAQGGFDFESHRRAYAVAQQTTVGEFNIVLYSAVGRYAFKIDHGRTD
jgi:hypothetical protein